MPSAQPSMQTRPKVQQRRGPKITVCLRKSVSIIIGLPSLSHHTLYCYLQSRCFLLSATPRKSLTDQGIPTLEIRLAAFIETIARLQADFLSFEDFHCISQVFMTFYDVQAFSNIFVGFPSNFKAFHRFLKMFKDVYEFRGMDLQNLAPRLRYDLRPP